MEKQRDNKEKKQKLSPMMEQYLLTKADCPDALLMYRLGDFYELFYEDAYIASKELDLTLTGRSCGLSERAPMCGVPFHAVDGYIAKLISKGFKVAIAEQADSESGSKIMKREIVKVITGGTVTEASMLDESRNNYLMCVYSENNSLFFVSWTDITTGELNYCVCDGLTKLNETLDRTRPAEVICNTAVLECSVLLPSVKAGRCPPFCSYLDFKFDYQSALAFLDGQLGKDKLKKLSNKGSVCSLGAMFEYILSTQMQPLSYINNPQMEQADGYLFYDSTARRTLEIEENLSGGKNGTLVSSLNKTRSKPALRQLVGWIRCPLVSVEQINLRLDAVGELKDNVRLRDELGAVLSRLYDIERLGTRLSCQKINPRECIALVDSLVLLPKISQILAGAKSELLKRAAGALSQKVAAADYLDSAIMRGDDDRAVPNNTRDGGVIREGFDASLDEMRSLRSRVGDILKKMEAFERAELKTDKLKIVYNRVFGYSIEVLNSANAQIPYRYIRKQTVANAERYITEELKDIEAKVLNADENIVKREAELYINAVSTAAADCERILALAREISVLDCLLSFATVAAERNYVRPTFNNRGEIRIKEGRHAIAETLMATGEFVANDTFLNDSDNKTMIITGPNMSGKSVYMRQVALIVIMAQSGCFVPADSCDICVVDKLFTRVGAGDDMLSGRSTFMVEMSEVAYILQNVTDKSLVLLDEVGRGTSTYDGLSIAWAIVEHLCNNYKAKTLFSTHYHELSELEGLLYGVKNYKLSVREIGNSIVFMRKLMRGGANRSFGIEVAALSELPSSLISRAKEILSKLNLSDPVKQMNSQNSKQMSFFDNGGLIEAGNILRELCMDDISPKSAHDILCDLIEKVKL